MNGELTMQPNATTGLLAAIVVLLPGTAEAVDPIILPGIIHQWSGDGDATDSIGNADGTIIEPVVFGGGKFGQAFDIQQGWVEFGTEAGNFGTSDFTISLWVWTEMNAKTGLIDKRPDCGAGDFFDMRHFPDDGVFVSLCDHPKSQGCHTIQGAVLVNDGQWHHIVMRREALIFSLFVDGGSDGSRVLPFIFNITNAAPIWIGRSACTDKGTEQPFVGLIDEVQLYDRALTDEEIELLAIPPCPSDLNDDNEVGILDLLILLGFWGPCGGICIGDLDGDGSVGIVDFLFLLAAWGPCP